MLSYIIIYNIRKRLFVKKSDANSSKVANIINSIASEKLILDLGDYKTILFKSYITMRAYLSSNFLKARIPKLTNVINQLKVVQHINIRKANRFWMSDLL